MEDDEVAHWATELGVSVEKLRQAIHAVGASADKVRECVQR